MVFGGGNVHFVGECVQFGEQNVHLMWRNLLSLAQPVSGKKANVW